jgi:hypothetical protein
MSAARMGGMLVFFKHEESGPALARRLRVALEGPAATTE